MAARFHLPLTCGNGNPKGYAYSNCSGNAAGNCDGLWDLDATHHTMRMGTVLLSLWELDVMLLLMLRLTRCKGAVLVLMLVAMVLLMATLMVLVKAVQP